MFIIENLENTESHREEKCNHIISLPRDNTVKAFKFFSFVVSFWDDFLEFFLEVFV